MITLFCPHKYALNALRAHLLDLQKEGWDARQREAIFRVQELLHKASKDADQLVSGRQRAQDKAGSAFNCGSDCDTQHLLDAFCKLCDEFARLAALFVACIRQVDAEGADQFGGKFSDFFDPEHADGRDRLMEVAYQVEQVAASLIVKVGGVGNECR